MFMVNVGQYTMPRVSLARSLLTTIFSTGELLNFGCVGRGKNMELGDDLSIPTLMGSF